MQTCEDQRKCISWSITEDSDGSTCAGDCDMTVCLTIDLSLGGCSKDGAISHTCVKGTDQCTGTGGFGGGVSTEVGSGAQVSNGGRQCQTGKPGETLQFLLKDGQSCDSGGGATVSIGGSSASATCAPRAGDVSSCTGNGVGKECVWTIVLPACTTDAPTVAPTDAPTVSPMALPTSASTIVPASSAPSAGECVFGCMYVAESACVHG